MSFKDKENCTRKAIQVIVAYPKTALPNAVIPIPKAWCRCPRKVVLVEREKDASTSGFILKERFKCY